MRFNLSTSGYFYPKEGERKKLEKLGFTFTKPTYTAHEIQGKPIIEINSIEELTKLADEHGTIIVHPKEDGEYELEIYNYYRE